MRYIVIISILLFLGCDRPQCRNTNPVFDKFTPGSREYRAELVSQLRKADPHRLNYWMDDVQIINSKRYLEVHVQGGDLCAKALLDIGDWKKELSPGSMIGYKGAELTGLQYEVINDSTGPWLRMVKVERIID